MLGVEDIDVEPRSRFKISLHVNLLLCMSALSIAWMGGRQSLKAYAFSFRLI